MIKYFKFPIHSGSSKKVEHIITGIADYYRAECTNDILVCGLKKDGKLLTIPEITLSKPPKMLNTQQLLKLQSENENQYNKYMDYIEQVKNNLSAKKDIKTFTKMSLMRLDRGLVEFISEAEYNSPLPGIN